MSPRSGTPVKLLGREDASVDWYNLEKSKRVKAFRCGEFDDCIERAEASLGLPAKKREKYARREDAILHALELEKQFLEKKYGKLVITSSIKENAMDYGRKDLATSSRALANGNGKLESHDLYQLDRKVDVSRMMEKSTLHGQKTKDGIHPILEEQDLESGHRIRGLQDFGLRTVPVNRIYTSAASDDSNRMPVTMHARDNAANDPCFDNSGDSDSRNGSRKGKRSFEGFVQESVPKRRARYRTDSPGCSFQPDADHIAFYGKRTGDGVCHSMYFPVESTAIFDAKNVQHVQMSMPVSQLDMDNIHPQHDNSAEQSTSGSSEETESDSSETHSLEPHVDGGMVLSDAETGMKAQSRMLDRLEIEGAGHESTSSDESDELSPDERSQFYIHDPNASGVGVSKWQLKGKRNVRNFGRRPIDKFAHRLYLQGRGRSLSQRTSNSLSYYHETDFNDNDVDFIDVDTHTHGISKRGYLPSQVPAKRSNFVGQSMIDWDELTWGRPFRGYWEERGDCYNTMFAGRNGNDMLIDVDLKVQANRQGEHVPWVSLMSRLNGKAIIGHPIQIEALEDGSTDVLVSTSDAYDDAVYGLEKNKVPPVWRTARRTANFRVPRPHLPTQLDDCDEDVDSRYFHQAGKVRSKKSLGSNSFRKVGSAKKTNSHVQGLKKPSRKVNQSSNQKTKPLSSIGFDQKSGNRRGGCDTSYYMDGVLKLVDSGPPAVACIPVKLVFSRLLEAVGRPPSGLVKHRCLSEQQHKERNPS